jgi:hypothetical protein
MGILYRKIIPMRKVSGGLFLIPGWLVCQPTGDTRFVLQTKLYTPYNALMRKKCILFYVPFFFFLYVNVCVILGFLFRESLYLIGCFSGFSQRYISIEMMALEWDD